MAQNGIIDAEGRRVLQKEDHAVHHLDVHGQEHGIVVGQLRLLLHGRRVLAAAGGDLILQKLHLDVAVAVEILAQRGVNSDIFLDEFKLMQSVYYADKIPNYIRDLANGKRKLKNTYEIRTILCDLIKKYNCKFVVAHNMRFDYRACNNLQRWTTKSKYRYFFPKGIEFWDTLKMAQDTIAKMPQYEEFCFENGFVTKHTKPRVKTTAEVLYRFITNNIDFEEKHTGLEDVEIEIEIFKFCMKLNLPTMRKKLFEEN